MKLSLTRAGFLLAVLLSPLLFHDAAAQAPFGSKKQSSSLRSSVSFVWLSDFDNQGVLFDNRFHTYIGDKFGVGLNVGLLSSSRYDDVKEIYTIKNTYFQAGLEASYDIIQNEAVAFRFGVGPMARLRSELTANENAGGTLDGSLTHVKKTDIGANAFIENDFAIWRNGVAGGRIAYQYFTEGTEVLSFGLHLGFQF